MAFGGAGIAISRGLAAKLERTLDGCLAESQTHWLDERLWGCVRPLGVEVQHLGGAHQMDIEGDMLGFLEAHPREPFVSMHHLHKVQLPISQSLIFAAMRADEPRFLQRIACTRPLPPTRWAAEAARMPLAVDSSTSTREPCCTSDAVRMRESVSRRRFISFQWSLAM